MGCGQPGMRTSAHVRQTNRWRAREQDGAKLRILCPETMNLAHRRSRLCTKVLDCGADVIGLDEHEPAFLKFVSGSKLVRVRYFNTSC